MQRYHLFRIATQSGEETFIVAENERTAAEIYTSSFALKDGEHRLYRVVQWGDRISERQRLKLIPFLFYGPAGVAKWCGTCGWSVDPPG